MGYYSLNADRDLKAFVSKLNRQGYATPSQLKQLEELKQSYKEYKESKVWG